MEKYYDKNSNSFSETDLEKTIKLIGFNWGQIKVIVVTCFMTGILSIIVPLLRNLRRNLTKDIKSTN